MPTPKMTVTPGRASKEFCHFSFQTSTDTRISPGFECWWRTCVHALSGWRIRVLACAQCYTEAVMSFQEPNSLRVALAGFYATLTPRLDKARAYRLELDRYKATRFNVFDYVRPDENRLSDILHDLLDPSGTHGQGAIFLNCFLEMIGGPPEFIQPPYSVKREDRTLYCA